MSQRTACLRLSTFPAAALGLLLGACGGGGGGGDAGTVPATTTVTSVAVGTPKYSQKLLVTVTGTALDRGLTVASPACTGMALSTTSPNVSSATTAYFQCTVVAVGASRVAVAATAGGAELGSANYTVPAPQVTMTVSNGAAVSGSFVIALDVVKAPITANNFLAYVNAGFYDATVFHRILPGGAAVQGGGYTPFAVSATPVAKPASAPIDLEATGLSNVRWSVAAWRTAVAKSATSQFFINAVDNSASFDADSTFAGYAVFGAVTPATTATVASMIGAPCTPMTGFSECAPFPNIAIASAIQTQ